MEVKEYENARAFINEYEAVLLEREAVSQLVLYNAYQGIKLPADKEAYYGAVLEGNTAVLLYSCIMPYNLSVYSTGTDHIEQASIALADFLGNNHVVVNGIYGKYEVCQGFIEQYKKHTGCTFMEKQGMDIMELRELNDIKLVEGTHRLAMQAESKLVAEWIIEFQMEARTSEMDYEAALSIANNLLEKNKVYFFENSERKIVTMAAASRELAHGVGITYVFTPEEYRGMGYAAANIYYLSKELLEKGYEFCTLFVDKKNPLSNRSYEKVGYKILEDIYEYKMIPAET